MSEIEEIKSKLNVVDIVSRYVDLKSAGKNYKGLCPFHQEKSPSFIVNPELQIFKCFGCGKSGDMFTFIQEIERLEFPDALKQLAEEAGVELKSNNYSNPELQKEKELLYKINELAAKFYHHLLLNHKSGDKARKYAQKRGLTSKELQKFQFGVAPKGKTNLKNFLVSKNFKEEDLLKYGLIIERNGETIDKFRDRLMQPLFDIQGRVVGFSGRYLGDFDKAPKYLNSSESIIYKKNEQLYSLFHSKEAIRKSNTVILVEGNLDVVSSHKAGVENILAPLGTAFTSNQARLIKRYADEVLFCFDSDSAGINATIRALPVVEEIGLNHKIIDLKKFGDSDELINSKNGAELWNETIANPVNTVDFIRKIFLKNLDLGTPDGKNKLKKYMFPILKSLKDPIQIKYQLKELSLILELDISTLEEDLKNTKANRQIIEVPKEEEQVEVKKNKKEYDLEKYFLELLLLKGDLSEFDFENVLTSPTSSEFFEILIETNGEMNKEIAETFDENILNLYKELVLNDYSYIKSIDDEIKKIYKMLQKAKYKKDIMHIRTELAKDEGNEELIKELNNIARKLRS